MTADPPDPPDSPDDPPAPPYVAPRLLDLDRAAAARAAAARFNRSERIMLGVSLGLLVLVLLACAALWWLPL
jgi:hypothetical protein